MPYTPTTWVNDTAPPLSAANLNKLTDELRSQALSRSITQSLPTWLNGAPPALTDAAPLAEMERVTRDVAVGLGLSYTVTSWSAGWTPSRNAARMNKLEQQAMSNRAAIDALTSGTGTLWDSFTDFYNRAWGYNEHPNGDIFVNRWRTPSGYQGLADAVDNWPSAGGAAIREVTTAKGPGFRFICNAEMNNGAGVKRVELCDVNAGGSPHGTSAQRFARGNGYTDEIRFWVRYPSSGNPSGIPGNTNRWNLCFQLFDNSANSINLSMGINMENSQRRFFFDAMKPQGQSAGGTSDAIQMQFDVDYRVKMQIKWATSGGYMRTYIDDVQYLNYSGATVFGASNALLGCFTYYGPSSLNNEVIVSDVRMIQV